MCNMDWKTQKLKIYFFKNNLLICIYAVQSQSKHFNFLDVINTVNYICENMELNRSWHDDDEK